MKNKSKAPADALEISIGNVLQCAHQNAGTQRRIIFVLLSALAVFSLMIDLSALPSLPALSGGFRAFVQILQVEGKAVTIESILASAFVTALLYALVIVMQRRPSVKQVVLSLIFSLFLTFGECFRYCGSFYAMFHPWEQTVVLVFVTLGYCVIISSCIEIMAMLLPGILVPKQNIQAAKDPYFVRKVFGLLLLCWVLFSLPYFPGSVTHDGRVQLLMFDGYAQMTNSHPYVSSLLLGAAAALGRMLFGEHYGVFLIVMIQMLFGAFVFTSIVDTIRVRLSRRAANLTFLFYALCPLWWTYMQAVIKDTVFFVAFSWLTLLCLMLFWGERKPYHLIQVTIAAFLVCAFRHEGIYYAALLLALTALLTRSHRKLAVTALGLAVMISIAINVSAGSFANAGKENPLEQLSIPVQQVARVIQQRKEEIPAEDLKIVNDIFKVEGIEDRYDPELSDPVKNHYRTISDEEWKAFWKLYLYWAIKYPGIYIDALAGETFGYFDPLYFYNGMAKYQLYTKDFLNESDKGIVYSQYLTSDRSRSTLYYGLLELDKIPVLSFTVNPAAYVWLVLSMLILLPHRRPALYLLVPLVNIIICIFSPVNGFVRYMLPLAATMPLYVALIFPKKDA